MTTATLPTDIELRIPDDLAEDSREKLRALLEPIFADAGPLCVQAREITVTDEDDEEGMQRAATLRKRLVKIRTGSEKQRKELKAEAQRQVTAIDGIFRPLRQAIEAHEEHLARQEKYREIQERKRQAQVDEQRHKQLTAMNVNPSLYQYRTMTDEQFEQCVKDIEAKQELDRLRAEKEAEEAKRREAEQQAERERQRAEHERAQQELEQQREENERLRQQQEAERAAREAEERERAEQEQAEREKQQHAEQAPDKEKLTQFVARLHESNIPCPFELTTPRAREIMDQFRANVAALANWLEAQVKTL